MLSILSTPRKFQDVLVYDMEWIPGTLEIRLVGIYDGKYGYRAYASVKLFLEYELTSRNRGRLFYAHAGGLADVQFVLEAVIQVNREYPGTYQVHASFSGSSAIIVHVSRGKNSWHFVDSYWLLRDKLKNIGISIGLLKGGIAEKDDPDEDGLTDTEFDRRLALKREWFRSTPINELRDYNEQDCLILYKAIYQFQLALLEMGGQLQMTLASCAMNLFRRKYLSNDIETCYEVNDFAKESYIASRVEVFQSSVQDANYYDINSSFPYAMTQPCPGEYIGCTDSIPTKDSIIYITDALVEVPEATITPLPYRHESGRVFFPFGKWRSHFTNIDIELLQKEGGRILKVYETQMFHPFHDLREYATDIYNKRKAATDDFTSLVYKLLLNSLYGKFAESAKKTSLRIDPDEIRPSYEMLFPGAFLETHMVPVPHVHVPISAHITAMARRTLFNFMSSCCDFHYCDTDGFSTSEVLSTGKELGDLKLEKQIINGYFAAPKVYGIEGKELNKKSGEWENKNHYKAKGFSRMTASRFLKVIEGEYIEYERMSRIRERFRKGLFNPHEAIIKKRLKIGKIIPKRFTYPDGYTRPWHVDEIK